MPDLGHDEDLDLDLDGEEDTDGEDGGDAAEPPKDAKPDDKTDKRIRDLQSQLDKEKARANQLEKLAGKGKDADQGDGTRSNDPETAALRQELREASLDAVYGEFKELRDFGIDRSLIEGATRAEMREAATALVGLIKSVETKARNKALSEHGIKAEPAGTTRTPPKDFAAMSDEEFEKVMAQNRAGGPPIW